MLPVRSTFLIVDRTTPALCRDRKPWVFLFFNDTCLSTYLFIYLKYFIYLFLERGREGEREGEKPQCVVASHAPPTGDLAHNPGMCPNWDSNQRSFGLQAGAQPLSHTSQGEIVVFFYLNKILISCFVVSDIHL